VREDLAEMAVCCLCICRVDELAGERKSAKEEELKETPTLGIHLPLEFRTQCEAPPAFFGAS
jgi:hypothetical protein